MSNTPFDNTVRGLMVQIDEPLSIELKNKFMHPPAAFGHVEILPVFPPLATLHELVIKEAKANPEFAVQLYDELLQIVFNPQDDSI